MRTSQARQTLICFILPSYKGSLYSWLRDKLKGHFMGDNIKKRHVFFVAGLMPSVHKFCLNQIKSAIRNENENYGTAIDVSDPYTTDAGNYAVSISNRSKDDGLVQCTTYEILDSNDEFLEVHRQYVLLAWIKLLLLLPICFPLFTITGLYRIMRHSKAVGVSMLMAWFNIYPLLIIGGFIWACVIGGVDLASYFDQSPYYLYIKGITVLILLHCSGWLLKKMDKYIYIHYFYSLTLYLWRYWLGFLPSVDQKINQHVQQISIACKDDTIDEVIVSAHSNGSVIATKIFAAISAYDLSTWHTKPHLLTSGAWTFATMLTPSKILVLDIKRLLEIKGLNWVDVFSPYDRITSARFNPISLMDEKRLIPYRVSARFRYTKSKEIVDLMKFKLFNTHFLFFSENSPRDGKRVKWFDYIQLISSSESFSEHFNRIKAERNHAK